eukprot:CAMPEP_0181373566 /NCGR_PEP_ID=MMETSP1106-20121128/15457_1 /TAXON_ID=81844 /ORGANISM="Mantoniella antarctica, Strain SL-175" /LENGTH=40 /DNA_ID= /DNA_START= /DNA_END= /DNA_ORIENTATION=
MAGMAISLSAMYLAYSDASVKLRVFPDECRMLPADVGVGA